MKVLAILSQKGGVGKTTLATCLAVAAEQAGKETAIIDLDPQATASFWKDVRQLDTPAVASIQPVRLAAMPMPARATPRARSPPRPRAPRVPSQRVGAPCSRCRPVSAEGPWPRRPPRCPRPRRHWHPRR